MRHLISLSWGAACVFCLSGCGSQTQSGVDVDRAYRSLVPVDTTVLAGINLDKLKGSPLYQRHEKDFALPAMEGASERIGIDPRRDLSDALVAWNGKRALVLARGRFQRVDVEQKLLALHASQSTYKNHRVFGEGANTVNLLGKDLAVEGALEDVQKTIDADGSKRDSVPEQLRERLRQVPAGDQIWVVSQGGLPFADAPMRSDVASALSNIVSFISGATAGVKADTGIHFQIDLTCISEQGAQRVRDALKGAIGLGRLSTKDNERALLQVYDAVNVDQEKETVHVHADYPAELTDKLLEQLGQIGKAIRR